MNRLKQKETTSGSTHEAQTHSNWAAKDKINILFLVSSCPVNECAFIQAFLINWTVGVNLKTQTKKMFFQGYMTVQSEQEYMLIYDLYIC